MEIDLEKLNIPDSDYSATVQMPSTEFQKTISSLSPLGDAVTIGVTQNNVKFSITGECNGSTNIKQSADIDDDTSTIVTVKEDITLTFAMRYLGHFTKATNLSSSVILSLSPNVPLVVEYQIEDGSGSISKLDLKKEVKKNTKRKRGYIRYYLAPKIDEES